MRSMAIRLVGIAASAATLSGLHAEETGAERHAMAREHLQRAVAEMSEKCLSDVRNLEDWQKQRPELRRSLLEMLGLDPLPPRTPLEVQITGRLEHPQYHIEKIVFQSMPGLYVTGNFYVPAGSPGSLPTILYLCGHMPHPLGAKFHFQDRGIWFASHGYACLVLDTLEYGELAGIHHGTHSLNMWNWLSLGYTPAGVEVWNAVRALDYLETRPEVDARRIGLTGISGGGAITWYTAAVDERVAVAAPVCSTLTFGSQAKHWVARGQCDCIYYHNTYQLDFPVVGALIAPRPLLMVGARKDWVFPPDGYHEAYRRTKKIYDLYAGAGTSGERIREVDDDVEHTDAPLFLREARSWMQRWLKKDASPLPPGTDSPPREAAEALACLNRPPTDAINFRIHYHFTAAVSLKEPNSTAAWDARRAQLMGQLRDKVFRWFPRERVPFETTVTRNTGGWAARYGYASFKEFSFQSESGVRIRAQLYTPPGRPGAPLLIHLKRAVDSVASSDVDELLPLMGRYAILVLNPRFTEQSMTPAEYADLERSSVWVGRTLAAAHVWDTLRAVEWAAGEGKMAASSMALYGRGEMGIVCLYAALFDERIKLVILNDPPGSHRQAPALLNVLRVTDIPEVAGALAPRPIVSLTKLPDSFRHTRSLYRLEGASEKFVQAGSLPEALDLRDMPAHPARPGDAGERRAPGAVPEVPAHRMLSGALLADGFDGPAPDARTWHRPDWLVKNDPGLSVGIRDGRLRISGVSRPGGRDHQYTGVLSTSFRETDVVVSARIRVGTSFDKPGRIRHQVHLCTGDWPDFFTEVNFGKIDTGPPRWHGAFLDRIWEYTGYGKYVNPALPATGEEATDWHQLVMVHDGTTRVSQNYLVRAGAWQPVGPPHRIEMNHSHVELKVDVAVPGVRVEVDFDDVRLYPGPSRHPVTIVVDSPLDRTRTRPEYPIEDLKVRLVEEDSKQVLGEGLTDKGGQAQVPLRSDVIFPVAARIEVWDDVQMLLTATIPREGVRGLYPSDVWVVRRPSRPKDG